MKIINTYTKSLLVILIIAISSNIAFNYSLSKIKKETKNIISSATKTIKKTVSKYKGYFLDFEPVYYSPYVYSWDYSWTGYSDWYVPDVYYSPSYYPYYYTNWDYWYPYSYISPYNEFYLGDYFYWRKSGGKVEGGKTMSARKRLREANKNKAKDGKLRISAPKDATFGDVKDELKTLKKEVFEDENQSTEEIRKNKKGAYSNEWLLKQLKITKIVELDNLVNEHKKKLKEDKEDKKEEKVTKQEDNDDKKEVKEEKVEKKNK